MLVSSKRFRCVEVEKWPYADVRLESCVEVFTSTLENTMNAVNKPRFPGNVLLMNNIHSRSLSLLVSSHFILFFDLYTFLSPSCLRFSLSHPLHTRPWQYLLPRPVWSRACANGAGSSDSELSVWD